MYSNFYSAWIIYIILECDIVITKSKTMFLDKVIAAIALMMLYASNRNKTLMALALSWRDAAAVCFAVAAAPAILYSYWLDKNMNYFKLKLHEPDWLRSRTTGTTIISPRLQQQLLLRLLCYFLLFNFDFSEIRGFNDDESILI